MSIQHQSNGQEFFDFNTRKICISADFGAEGSCLVVAPLTLDNLGYFKQWSDLWATVRGLEPPSEIFRTLEHSSISYKVLDEDYALVKFGDLQKLKWYPFFWNDIRLFNTEPTSYGEKPALRIGLKGVKDAEGTLWCIADKALVEELWLYSLRSHLISQQVCSTDVVFDYTSRINPRDFEGKFLLYWGYRIHAQSPQFVYLLIPSANLGVQTAIKDGWISPLVPVFNGPKGGSIETSEGGTVGQMIETHYSFDKMDSLLLDINGVKIVPFDEVKEEVIEPVMPFARDLRGYDHFAMRVQKVEGGYLVEHVSPMPLRSVLDFLSCKNEWTIYYKYTGYHQGIVDNRWISESIENFKRTAFYFFYDDACSSAGNEEPAKFAILNGQLSQEECEKYVVIDRKHNYADSPCRFVGTFHDGVDIQMQLRHKDDMLKFLSYAVLYLFKRRFAHFPNDTPEHRICEILLDYLTNSDGMLIEAGDYVEEDGAYYLSVRFEKQQITIGYSGTWDIFDS